MTSRAQRHHGAGPDGGPVQRRRAIRAVRQDGGSRPPAEPHPRGRPQPARYAAHVGHRRLPPRPPGGGAGEDGKGDRIRRRHRAVPSQHLRGLPHAQPSGRRGRRRPPRRRAGPERSALPAQPGRHPLRAGRDRPKHRCRRPRADDAARHGRRPFRPRRGAAGPRRLGGGLGGIRVALPHRRRGPHDAAHRQAAMGRRNVHRRHRCCSSPTRVLAMSSSSAATSPGPCNAARTPRSPARRR